MAGTFDIDLIPRVLSVDRKVGLSGIEKRREQRDDARKKNHSRKAAGDEADEKGEEKHGAIDITV